MAATPTRMISLGEAVSTGTGLEFIPYICLAAPAIPIRFPRRGPDQEVLSVIRFLSIGPPPFRPRAFLTKDDRTPRFPIRLGLPGGGDSGILPPPLGRGEGAESPRSVEEGPRKDRGSGGPGRSGEAQLR